MNLKPTEPHFYPYVLMAFCFFAGIFLGTLWVNLMAEEIQTQLGVFGQAGFTAGLKIIPFQPAAIFRVFLKREVEAGFLWLAGMTAFAVPGLCAVLSYQGFSMASVISLLTIQNGITGILVYLLSVFPQALCYMPVFLILFCWGAKQEKSVHPAGFAVLTAALFFGSILETCLNPYCMHFLTYIK